MGPRGVQLLQLTGKEGRDRQEEGRVASSPGKEGQGGHVPSRKEGRVTASLSTSATPEWGEEEEAWVAMDPM